ncbi:hypothetical protein [Streptomyces sp. NPDC047046]|uniref:hypothetical protein n=1 Tax=Streptomyces sp. NPDC047046 TaxID=3155378 RepID=UPI0033C57B95
MRPHQALFHGDQLRDVLDNKLASIVRSVDAWDPDTFLALPEADIIADLINDFRIEAPTLDHGGIQQEPSRQSQTTVDEFGSSVSIRETVFTIAVPFTGNHTVFLLQPSSYRQVPPKAAMTETELKVSFSWTGTTENHQAIRKGLEVQLDAIEEHLGHARQQIDTYNQQAEALITQHVQNRKKELLASRRLEAAIGFPIRKREDASTYAVPIKRKTIQTRPRPSASAPSQPDPFLADATYEEILRVLRNTRNQLERTPSLTYKFGEEEIRNQLLLALNGQFEGAAMGEVFNYQGKTDILIRAEDRNVFIGECKIWDGPKTITDGLDQLLGLYLTWRDTKAALVLFVREGVMSEIISKAVKKIEEHTNFVRHGQRSYEFGERHDFVLHANGDPDREINLAFLPFHLPNRPGRTQSKN